LVCHTIVQPHNDGDYLPGNRAAVFRVSCIDWLNQSKTLSLCELCEREKPRVNLADLQGHGAVIVCSLPSEQKGLVEIDEVGIPVKGLGEDIGLRDGSCILCIS